MGGTSRRPDDVRHRSRHHRARDGGAGRRGCRRHRSGGARRARRSSPPTSRPTARGSRSASTTRTRRRSRSSASPRRATTSSRPAGATPPTRHSPAPRTRAPTAWLRSQQLTAPPADAGRITSPNDSFGVNTFATSQTVEALLQSWLPVARAAEQTVRDAAPPPPIEPVNPRARLVVTAAAVHRMTVGARARGAVLAVAFAAALAGNEHDCTRGSSPPQGCAARGRRRRWNRVRRAVPICFRRCDQRARRAAARGRQPGHLRVRGPGRGGVPARSAWATPPTRRVSSDPAASTGRTTAPRPAPAAGRTRAAARRRPRSRRRRSRAGGTAPVPHPGFVRLLRRGRLRPPADGTAAATQRRRPTNRTGGRGGDTATPPAGGTTAHRRPRRRRPRAGARAAMARPTATTASDRPRTATTSTTGNSGTRRPAEHYVAPRLGHGRELAAGAATAGSDAGSPVG